MWCHFDILLFQLYDNLLLIRRHWSPLEHFQFQNYIIRWTWRKNSQLKSKNMNNDSYSPRTVPQDAGGRHNGYCLGNTSFDHNPSKVTSYLATLFLRQFCAFVNSTIEKTVASVAKGDMMKYQSSRSWFSTNDNVLKRRLTLFNLGAISSLIWLLSVKWSKYFTNLHPLYSPLQSKIFVNSL